jgi:FkbM family methyltransferase
MLPAEIKRFVRKSGVLFFGRFPRLHRIPFGPNKGRKIFTSFDISPRMYFGIDEPWIAELTQRHINPGDVVYDIGAHIGYTVLLFTQKVGNTGIVHAFEILPSVAEGFLRKTIEANDFNNVVIHAVGLSNLEQTLELPIGETMMTTLYPRASKGCKTELCKVVRLDDYRVFAHLPMPSLIKIDIEGAEVDCLLGALNIIKKCHPLLIIEFHSLDLLSKGHTILDSLGYVITTQKSIVDKQFLQNTDRFHESVFCSLLNGFSPK